MEIVVDLNLCNILDTREDGFQKCLIPNESFVDGVQPGTLAKCETDKEEIFLCYLFSLKNSFPQHYCFVDDSVRVGSNTDNKINSRKIIKIIPIDDEVIESEVLDVEVEINKNFFDFPFAEADLKDVIKEWLSKFTLFRNCVINGDKFLKSLGIESITIQSNLYAPYKVNADTKIVLANVFYHEYKAENANLKSLDYVLDELKLFVKDFNLRKKVDWKMKFSFNALISGPPGCGKTSICNNLFSEYKCNVFNITPSEIIRQYPGETEEILRVIYENVKHFVQNFKSNSPTVIYIEDIDILCPNVFESDSYNMVRVSSQIYSILDDLHLNQIDVLVIATTSQIDKVNVQLRRPGRFEKEIQVHIPISKERESIIRLILETSPIRQQVSEEIILNIVEQTPGFVGADLRLILHKVFQTVLLKSKSLKISQIELKDIFQNVVKTSRAAAIKNSDIKAYKCEETFEDIGGAIDLKNSLRVAILTPLKKPEVFKKFGLKLPKGILFYGPPGCAKTTVAKCLANQTNMTFISISGAEVYSPYVGKAEKFISKIFDTARRNAPCLIFFDEIETLVGKRTLNTKSDVQTRILSTLLQEMDGIGLKVDEGIKSQINENHILVIGATNRPDMIDDALLRPGRFDKLIHVSAPNAESRLEILKLLRKKMPFDENVNLTNLAEKTEYFSGADLCNLCNEAALYAFTRNCDINVICENDFKSVLKDLKPSLSKNQIDWYHNFENKHIC